MEWLSLFFVYIQECRAVTRGGGGGGGAHGALLEIVETGRTDNTFISMIACSAILTLFFLSSP